MRWVEAACIAKLRGGWSFEARRWQMGRRKGFEIFGMEVWMNSNAIETFRTAYITRDHARTAG
jgi:hypothetical protein